MSEKTYPSIDDPNLRSVRDREWSAFTTDTDGKVAKRVAVSDSGPSGGYVVAWQHTKISVNNTTAVEVPTTALTDRKTIEIYNSSAETIYAGPDGTVTAANGRPIFSNETWNVDIGDALSVFIITAASTFTLDVTEFA